MTVFFTSDTHFGHASMIRLAGRPYASVEEMDRDLIARWNAVVGPKDVVWHLGDFTMSNARAACEYLSALNGDINLVWGNHDRESIRCLQQWESSSYAAEIKVDGVHITLCHYPMIEWNKSHYGTLMLHGHCHGNLSGNSQRMDVGVDPCGYAPVTLPQIQQRLSAMPEYTTESHHKRVSPREEEI